MFKDIVGFCGDILQAGSQSAGTVLITWISLNHSLMSLSDLPKAEEGAHAVILGLLSSVSQFWSVEDLTRLVKLSLDSRSTSIALRKALPKKISSKQILPALLNVWANLLGDQTVGILF